MSKHLEPEYLQAQQLSKDLAAQANAKPKKLHIQDDKPNPPNKNNNTQSQGSYYPTQDEGDWCGFAFSLNPQGNANKIVAGIQGAVAIGTEFSHRVSSKISPEQSQYWGVGPHGRFKQIKNGLSAIGNLFKAQKDKSDSHEDKANPSQGLRKFKNKV